jgi:hypothetical protein
MESKMSYAVHNRAQPDAQQKSAPPTHENATASRDLELGAQSYWCALKHRTIEPDPSSVEYAQAAMAALVAGEDPAFLREILEPVAEQFCVSQKRNGRHVDNSSARLAGLRDGCISFPTIDWTADIFPVGGSA